MDGLRWESGVDGTHSEGGGSGFSVSDSRGSVSMYCPSIFAASRVSILAVRKLSNPASCTGELLAYLQNSGGMSIVISPGLL